MERQEIGCSYYDCPTFNKVYTSENGPFATIHLNMRSVKNKIDDLEIYLDSFTAKFDIIVLTETWLRKDEAPPHIQGYKSITISRENRRGGGIAVYVKNSYQYIVLDDLTSLNENVESLFVKVSNVVVGALYRPPSGIVAEFLHFFENALELLGHLAASFVILGDVNIDALSDGPCAKEFQDIVHEHACTNMITLPTRITADTATCIDVCVSNIETRNVIAGVMTSNISDHMPIFCLASVTPKSHGKKKHGTLQVRTMNEQTLENFRCLLEQADWEHVLKDTNPKTAYQKFLNQFLSCYNAAFPLREIKTKNGKIRKPWITKNLYKRIRERDKMYHAFIKKRDPALLADYKKIRNKLNSDLKKAKSIFYQNKFIQINGDHKKMWDMVNHLMSRMQTCDALREIMKENEYANGQELADEMNRHFVNIGQYAGKNTCTDNCLEGHSVSESVMLSPSTPTEIQTIIMQLKNDAAAGDDGIKALPLKYTAPIISPVLSHIINAMFQSGDYPEELKIAKVTPVHKGGNVLDINNYRPISVLPIFSKIFEKAMNNRLVSFFEKHHIITSAQYGFQKKKSTEMALIHIKEKIVENIENKLLTLGLFLDLKKAFDTVQHDILLKKLDMYGVRGIALNLIKSYLCERYQYVDIKGISSSKMRILYGVPQGSILGPFLFLVYINDITSITGFTDIVLYADDTNVFFTGPSKASLEKAANEYLLKLSRWLLNNKLNLNASKTKYIIFKPLNRRDYTTINITYDGALIEQVKEQKFLGVWFSEELSWTTHVNKLKADLALVTGSIYRIRNLIPTSLKQVLYYSLFYSRLSYGILVWGTTTAYNYNKLIVAQKKVLRFCENYRGDKRNLRTAPLFIKYNMLKANQVYYFKLLQWIHQNKPPITPGEHSSVYPIRNPKRRVPVTRTNYGRQKLTFQSTKLMNNSEMRIDLSKSFIVFKRECRRFLVTSAISYTTQ